MSTTERGRQTETMAVRYLEARDLEIIDRNWRTRYCELDLVARSGDLIHFIEIKYRATTRQGMDFDYITADKRARLSRAAASWSQQHRYTGLYQIDIISVTGDLDYPEITWLQSAIEGN